jgi:fluoride ion exporter CrcB/FEX
MFCGAFFIAICRSFMTNIIVIGIGGAAGAVSRYAVAL